jgi:hypothetical protein
MIIHKVVVSSPKQGFYYSEKETSPVWVATVHNHSEEGCKSFTIDIWLAIGDTDEAVRKYLEQRLEKGWIVARVEPLSLYLDVLASTAEEVKVQ